MKIEMTGQNKAIITKGWRNKRWADVYRNGAGGYWRFTKTDNLVGTWIGVRLDWAAHKFNKVVETPWTPVAKLPEARALPLTSGDK